MRPSWVCRQRRGHKLAARLLPRGAQILSGQLPVKITGIGFYRPNGKELHPLGASAFSILTADLKDQNETVRSAAAFALGQIRPMSDAAIAALTEALNDESEHVFDAVCNVLPALGDKTDGVTALLIERWKHAETLSIQGAAGRTLDRIGADPAVVVPALIRGSRHPQNLKESLVDLTIIGADEIAKGATEFAHWARRMRAGGDLDALRPFLRIVFDNSKKLVQIMNDHPDLDEGVEDMVYQQFYEKLFQVWESTKDNDFPFEDFYEEAEELPCCYSVGSYGPFPVFFYRWRARFFYQALELDLVGPFGSLEEALKAAEVDIGSADGGFWRTLKEAEKHADWLDSR